MSQQYYPPSREDRRYAQLKDDELLAGLRDLLAPSDEPWVQQTRTRAEDAGPGDRVNYRLARAVDGRTMSKTTLPILEITEDKDGNKVVVLGRRGGSTKQRAFPSQIKLPPGSQKRFDDNFKEEMEPFISLTKKLSVADRKAAVLHFVRGAQLQDGKYEYRVRKAGGPKDTGIDFKKVLLWLIKEHEITDEQQELFKKYAGTCGIANIINDPAKAIYGFIFRTEAPDDFNDYFNAEREKGAEGFAFTMDAEDVAKHKDFAIIQKIITTGSNLTIKALYKKISKDILDFFNNECEINPPKPTAKGAVIKSWASACLAEINGEEDGEEADEKEAEADNAEV